MDDLNAGDFIWTDEIDVAFGLPVIEWSSGMKTILPKYDWTIEYTGLMPQR